MVLSSQFQETGLLSGMVMLKCSHNLLCQSINRCVISVNTRDKSAVGIGKTLMRLFFWQPEKHLCKTARRLFLYLESDQAKNAESKTVSKSFGRGLLTVFWEH